MTSAMDWILDPKVVVGDVLVDKHGHWHVIRAIHGRGRMGIEITVTEWREKKASKSRPFAVLRGGAIVALQLKPEPAAVKADLRTPLNRMLQEALKGARQVSTSTTLAIA